MTNNTFEPGPIGEEAAKLLAAAQEWFHRTLGDPAATRIATGAPECAWCPVCQLISLLRGDRPEITEKLAETQTAVAGLLRALADAACAMNPHGAQQPTGSRVQKIDLGDDEPGD
jgi:DNA-binding transcriptional LysR family regulator